MARFLVNISSLNTNLDIQQCKKFWVEFDTNNVKTFGESLTLIESTRSLKRYARGKDII